MLRNGLFVLGILVLLLSGCQNSDVQKEKVSKGNTGFITNLDNQQILIKSTYYKITKSTRIQDLEGNHLSYADLKVGMKAKPWFEGAREESFPSKARAKFILVLKDKKSVAEQAAITSAIDHVTEAASQRFMVLDWSHVENENVYNIKMMNCSNLDTSFNVIVDDSTYKVVYQY